MSKALAEARSWVACPTCHSALLERGSQLECRKCGTSAAVLRDGLIDFLGMERDATNRILAWPDDELAAIVAAATLKFDRKPIDADQAALLRRFGLLDAHDRLTDIGRIAGYNSAELLWQSHYDPFEGLCETPVPGDDTFIVDIGGGSGQTLQRLYPEPRGRLCVIDVSLANLAYGSRLFRAHGLPIAAVAGSAETLPLPDNSVDFVICRGVIMYTKQKKAISEIFRVLKPGGRVFFRIESYRWDFNYMRETRRPVAIALTLRSLLIGFLHALTGYQPQPGRGWLLGPRAYVSRSRFRKMVAASGGKVERCESSPRGPQFGGLGTQDVALCVKRPAG